jgi:hypothetical protein
LPGALSRLAFLCDVVDSMYLNSQGASHDDEAYG